MKFSIKSTVLRLSLRFSTKQSAILQIVMNELGSETTSFSNFMNLSTDYLQNAIEFLLLHYNRLSTADTLRTGLV